MTFKIVLTCLFAVGIGVNFGMIGKSPDRVTSGSAFFKLVVNVLIIYGLWNWL